MAGRSLSNRLKDRLIQEAIERKIRRNEQTELNSGVNPLRESVDIPVAFYRFDQHPGYKRMQIIHKGAEHLGIVNPFFRVHEGIAGATTVIGGQEFINFANYNYLGLSGNKQVSDAAKKAIDSYGTSVSASRMVSGERPVHRQLEVALAETYQVQDAVVFVSGHATNVATIGYLFGNKDLIVHDELAHNSILMGAQLSGAKRLSFPHNDWQTLDRILSEHRRNYERVLIAIEGLYSMDGDYPDLPEFIEIKQKHRAFLMLDEAHSFGVMGKRGFGIREHFGIEGSAVDIWMGTLSKSLAGCGGYIAGESALVEHIKFLAPGGQLYSVGSPPQVVAASLEALSVMKSEPDRVQRLQKMSEYFLKKAKTVGINTGLSQGIAIIAAITGSSQTAARLSNALYNRGINVQPIMYPVVPEKSARLRFFMSSDHTEAQIDKTIQALVEEIHN